MLKIHSYETMSANDGPGLRTVFFVQGCNFCCKYCHNPDTQAMDAPAKLMSTEEILQILRKNLIYYGEEGGVTFSGGEVLLQAEELLQTMREIQKKLKISVVIDTNGSILQPAAKKVLTEAELVIFDLKEIDEEKHQELVKHSNKQTIEAMKYREKCRKPWWVRYVLVPGVTDEAHDLREWGKLVNSFKYCRKIEVLPYHTMGVVKYRESGREYLLEGVRAAAEADVQRARAIIEGE